MELKTEKGLYRSRIEASKRYDEKNVDNIRLRVPKGWGDLMKEHVSASDNYSSVNAMICDLIRKELGIE